MGKVRYREIGFGVLPVIREVFHKVQICLLAAFIIIIGIVYLAGRVVDFKFIESGMSFQFIVLPSLSLLVIAIVFIANQRRVKSDVLNTLPFIVLTMLCVYAEIAKDGALLFILVSLLLVYPFIVGFRAVYK